MWEWLTGLYRQTASRATMGYLHGQDAELSDRIREQGDCYVQLRLTDMHLAFERDAFAGQVPMLQSVTTTPSSAIPVPETIGPDAFAPLGQREFQRTRHEDVPLTGMLPWNARQGDLGMLVGLVAVRDDSLVRQTAQLLGSFSEMLQVPFLSGAADLATKVADGVERLFLATTPTGLLALETSVRWDQFQPGYYVATSLLEDNVPLSHLRVERKKLLRLDEKSSQWMVARGFNYLLLELAAFPDCGAAWESIPTIVQPRDAALDRLSSGFGSDAKTEAESMLFTAMIAARKSRDLTRSDRDRVARQLRADWDGAIGEFNKTNALRGASVPESETYGLLDRALGEPA